MPNIIAMTSADRQFSTLTSALVTAGMVDTLSGSGPFTLFAPTDEAFRRLPAALLESLLEPATRPLLTRILTLHVATDKWLRAGSNDRQTLPSLSGQLLPIAITHNGGFVGGATITATIEATNGIIYAIDTVLMPATT